MAYPCNPSTLRSWGGQITWGQEFETRQTISTKTTKISWVWWQTLVIPATLEAEAGESLENGRQRLQWAKIVPLHSSLTPGDGERLCLKKKKKNLGEWEWSWTRWYVRSGWILDIFWRYILQDLLMSWIWGAIERSQMWLQAFWLEPLEEWNFHLLKWDRLPKELGKLLIRHRSTYVY